MSDESDRPEQCPPTISIQDEKTMLESEKLRLEQHLLRRQLSRTGLAMEWLKSATVPAAVLGAAITFYIGFGQIEQAEQNRSAERFDKALARLSSANVVERLTGVSGLRLFLNSDDTKIRKDTLQFLISAASIEPNEFVQRAIINALEQVKGARVDIATLNAALYFALEQNRNLTASIITQQQERVRSTQVKILVSSKNLKSVSDEIPNPIPKSKTSKLSLDDYKRFKFANLSRFENLPPTESIPIKGLAKIISILVQSGASSGSFTDIYCELCDFRHTRSLEGANFEGAFLSQANFSHAHLKNSSFKNADLSGTLFFSADLTNADLSENTNTSRDYKKAPMDFPLLECANLKGANLTGTPLMVYFRQYHKSILSRFAWVFSSRLDMVQIDSNTKLDAFVIVTRTQVSDEYASKNPKSSVVTPTAKLDDVIRDPMIVEQSLSAQYRRVFDTVEENESKVLSTVYIQSSTIRPDNFPLIDPEKAIFFAGRFSKTPLIKLPLVSSFDRAINDLKSESPSFDREKAIENVPCDSDPVPRQLILARLVKRLPD